MAFIKVGKTRNVNLKVLLVFALVSALIFPIAASGQVGSQELEESQSSNWDQRKELNLIRVIGGPGSELFLDPTDIAVGESGNIYVADYGNKRIQILNSLGQLVQTIELKGSPHGITLDKDENIYVTEWWDFIGVEKFTKTGEPATDFQIEDQSVFGLPSDVVIDSDGILYVLEHRNLDIDYGENAGVHKIDTDGSYLEFVPIPDSSINDKSKFTLMTMDHEGYLYIVDQSGDDIILLDPTNGLGRALALINFQTPTSIAINPDGYFFISDQRYENNKLSIHIFDEYYLPIRTLAEPGKEEGKIWGTHGLEFDKDGNMYVVDFVQNKIQVFHIAPKVFGPLVYEETMESIPTTPQYSPSGDDLIAVLNTSNGQIVIEFFDEDAPIHVENFITLAENDWYNTTIFHRIIKDFMIQGGDPNTKPEPGNTSDMWGTGGPEYTIDAEFNSIKHERGIVSMARQSDPNSAGSQFFIMHKKTPSLDEQYTVFGRLITPESYETLDKIANLEVNSRNQPSEMSGALIFDIKIVPRSSVENILTMDPPNRTIGFIPDTPEPKFTSEESNFVPTSPTGWQVIEPIQYNINSPVYLTMGPNKDGIIPHIYVNSAPLGELDFSEFIDNRVQSFHRLNNQGEIEMSGETLVSFKGGDAYIVILKQDVDKDLAGNESYKAQLKQFLFATPTTAYGITYVNLETNFPDHLEVLNKFVRDFSLKGETAQDIFVKSLADPNWDGKYYNNEEYQFRLEIPYRYEPLLPKIIEDDDGVNHYIIALEPDIFHVNYYKDGVQSRYMFNIYDTDDKSFTEYSTKIKNIYRAYENDGELIMVDEYMGMTADGHPVYFVEYQEFYYVNEEITIPIHTREVIFASDDFLYKITYTNHVNNFVREITSFNYLLEFAKFSFDGKMKSVDFGPNIIKYNPVDDRDPLERGGCLIATATFGSEMAPQVQFLREIRDNTVLQTESGTSFMAGFNQFYYSFSPVIADYERENPVFKEAVKLTLTPLLTSLTLLQYTNIDSESEMLGYGIGIILLNIGMYFVAPAVLIMKIRTSYNKIPKNI